MKRATAPRLRRMCKLKVSHDVIAAPRSHLSKPGRLRPEISCSWKGIWLPVILSHLHPGPISAQSRDRRAQVELQRLSSARDAAHLEWKSQILIYIMEWHCTHARTQIVNNIFAMQQECKANNKKKCILPVIVHVHERTAQVYLLQTNGVIISCTISIS